MKQKTQDTAEFQKVGILSNTAALHLYNSYDRKRNRIINCMENIVHSYHSVMGGLSLVHRRREIDPAQSISDHPHNDKAMFSLLFAYYMPCCLQEIKPAIQKHGGPYMYKDVVNLI